MSIKSTLNKLNPMNMRVFKNTASLISFEEHLPEEFKSLINSGITNPDEVSIRAISAELRHFADRSLYDAFATCYLRNLIPTKRFLRKYTLGSVSSAAEGSDFRYYADDGQAPRVMEDGIAAITKLTKGRWLPCYSGIRDSYMLVTHDGIADIYLDIITDTQGREVSISAFGNARSINDLVEILAASLLPMTDRKATRLQIRGNDIVKQTIRLPDSKKFEDGYYPNVDVTPQELYDAWMADSSPAMVLFGPPGCGKSSFTSMLLAIRGYKDVVFVDDSQLYNHPGLVNSLREFDDDTFFIFEDADLLLRKREDDNHQMSGLLNLMSGVGERKQRFMFNTNLKVLKNIDEALLRPGRTFRSIEFGYIQHDQINVVRDRLGMPELPQEVISANEKWSLADVIHFGAGAKGTAFGFNK